MASHVPSDRLVRFCVKALPAQELLPIALHLAECRTCHQQFQMALARKRGYQPVSFSLESEDWLRHDHLADEHLTQYLADSLEAEDLAVAETHLSICSECREDVRVLRACRQATEPEMKIAYGPVAEEPESRRSRVSPWLAGIGRQLAFSVLVILGIAVAGLIFWMTLGRNGTEAPTLIASETRPDFTSDNGIEPRVRTTEAPAQVAAPTPQTRLSNQAPTLQGSANRAGPPAPPRSQPRAGGLTHKQPATPAKTGQGSGTEPKGDRTDLAALPAALRQEVTATLAIQRLEKPAVLAELVGGAATLRGNPADKQTFRLLGPVAQVTLATQPLLRWQALSAATGYRVFVLDAQGQEVAASSELPASQTTWQPAAPLPAGATYSWAVVALVGEKEVVAPAASQPEAKFHILAAVPAQTLTSALSQTRSHLALGILYARAGLLTEAERELQLYLKQHPQSAVARKLLRQIQSWH